MSINTGTSVTCLTHATQLDSTLRIPDLPIQATYVYPMALFNLAFLDPWPETPGLLLTVLNPRAATTRLT